MGTAIRLEDGGQVTLTSAPQAAAGAGGRRTRLSVYGPIDGGPAAATVNVLLYRQEARELVVELLHRLKGGDEVARLPGALCTGDVWAVSLDRLVALVCGETVAPAAASEEGGEPT